MDQLMQVVAYIVGLIHINHIAVRPLVRFDGEMGVDIVAIIELQKPNGDTVGVITVFSYDRGNSAMRQGPFEIRWNLARQPETVLFKFDNGKEVSEDRINAWLDFTPWQ